MKNSSSIRVGVVGAGFGRQVLVPAFRTDPRCEVTMLCASSGSSASAAAVALGIPQATADWRELVACDQVDAVAIAVPPPLQPRIAAAALAAGKHVFCEKPLATTAKDAETLLEAARQTGRAHAVDFELPELASWRTARALLAEGAVGKRRHAYVRWHVETRAHKLRELDTWKVRASAGGGSLLNFGAHVLHYVEWLLGSRARHVSARFAPDAERDARFDAWLELDDGTPVTIAVATDVPFGTGHCIDVYGDAGRLTLENTSIAATANFVLTLATRDGGVKVVIDERQPDRGESRIEPVASVVRRFVDSMFGEPVTYPDFAAGARVNRLVDAIRGSAARGAGLDV